MTELLEKRIAEISEAVANGVVVQADAQFLLQMLVAQGDNMACLNEEIEKLKLELDAAVEGLKFYENTTRLMLDVRDIKDPIDLSTTIMDNGDKARAVLAMIEQGEK